MRYSIWGRQYGSDHDVELVRCNDNPQAIVDRIKAKTVTVRHGIFENTKRKTSKVPKYTYLRIVDHGKQP